MSNGSEGPGERDGNAVDPGPPIKELAALGDEPSPRFIDRVRNAINRRLFAAQAIDVPWWGFSQMILEYVQFLLSLIGLRDKDEERES